MCSRNGEKLKLIDKEFQLYMKKQDFSTSITKKSENVYLFISLSRLASFGVCIYIQYYFDAVRINLQTKSIY